MIAVPKNNRRLSLFSASTCAVAILCAASVHTAHASIPPFEEQAPKIDRLSASPNVLRAQKALSKLGLYLGPEDGHLDQATRATIRIYQRATGIDITGRITLDMIGKLEYAVSVRKLMRQLEETRSKSITDARSKLLSHPVTRDLIKSGKSDDVADPTRDATQCFDQPTTMCLLSEALESAKAIGKAELRDWALGEILIAEARAGLGERAMETASRINDPRLVMVALRDIAEAQAAGGNPEEALAAADIIPDPDKQADAFTAIAEIQVRRGDKNNARRSVEKMLSDIDNVSDRLKQIALRTRAAVILANADARDEVEVELTIAEQHAHTLPRDCSKSAGIRYVASALADMQETARALEMLESVSSPSDKIPVLMSAAEAQARAGDAAAALATASSIENVRYRAIVLGRIALAQSKSGQIEDADTTLDIAMAAIDRIDRPYTRSFAISRIALAMIQVHAGDGIDSDSAKGFLIAAKRAVEAANLINDRRLKARTLWLISERQRALNDPNWEATTALAETATAEVTGALSQVWMFAGLAEGHALAGESEAGWRAFEHGVEIARTIDNAWSRARTLAKLASTLICLVDPGLGHLLEKP